MLPQHQDQVARLKHQDRPHALGASLEHSALAHRCLECGYPARWAASPGRTERFRQSESSMTAGHTRKPAHMAPRKGAGKLSNEMQISCKRPMKTYDSL